MATAHPTAPQILRDFYGNRQLYCQHGQPWQGRCADCEAGGYDRKEEEERDRQEAEERRGGAR